MFYARAGNNIQSLEVAGMGIVAEKPNDEDFLQLWSAWLENKLSSQATAPC